MVAEGESGKICLKVVTSTNWAWTKDKDWEEFDKSQGISSVLLEISQQLGCYVEMIHLLVCQGGYFIGVARIRSSAVLRDNEFVLANAAPPFEEDGKDEQDVGGHS